MISVFERVEDAVGKGEMLVTNILTFSHVFIRLFPRGVKSRNCVVKGFNKLIICPILSLNPIFAQFLLKIEGVHINL